MFIRKKGKFIIFVVIALCFVIINGVSFNGFAQAPTKQIKLKFATHLPSIHHGYRNFIAPWAAEVEKRTEGRVKVIVYPDQQLGRLPEMYDDLLRGTSDIALILPVFITGRFPLESVFHLPNFLN